MWYGGGIAADVDAVLTRQTDRPRLDPAVGEVERLVLELRHREREAFRISGPLPRVLLDLRAAGIRQADELGDLVEGLADGIVAVGVEAVPKLECARSATFGVKPKRRISSAARTVVSAITSALGSKFTYVSQMNTVRFGSSNMFIAA